MFFQAKISETCLSFFFSIAPNNRNKQSKSINWSKCQLLGFSKPGQTLGQLMHGIGLFVPDFDGQTKGFVCLFVCLFIYFT